LVYEGNYNFNRWKDSLLETERLKKENLRSELEGLRNQVNPHFLFNSLNTLVSIIPEDPDKAVDFVQRLSHIFRYVLDMQERETVSLREEMECLFACYTL
jgi:LytS/YehU family sensor histidine kinase